MDKAVALIPLRVRRDHAVGPVLSNKADIDRLLARARGAATSGDLAMVDDLLGRAIVLLSVAEDESGALFALLAASSKSDSAALRKGESGDRIGDVEIYDRYFGVERVRQLSTGQAALAQLSIVVDLVEDLRSAHLVADDVKALLDEALRMLGAMDVVAVDHPGDEGGAVAGPAARARSDPLARWKLGHRVYASACRAGAADLHMAVDLFEKGDFDAAGSKLSDGGDRLQGLTAAMVLAAAISSVEYVENVRPTMAPPASSIELTGSMNLDYGAFKQAVSRLRVACHDYHWVDLARRNSRFATTIDRLLCLDLLNLERHIELTRRLVGGLPALHEHDAESAVASLRSMYINRLRDYGPLLRHGRITDAALDRANDVASPSKHRSSCEFLNGPD